MPKQHEIEIAEAVTYKLLVPHLTQDVTNELVSLLYPKASS
jgi:hypothetical protein